MTAIAAKRGRGRPVRDLLGMRFGRLIIVGRAPETVRTGTNVWWAAWCDCGRTRYVPSRNLVLGNTKSCGCWRQDHGVIVGRANAANLKHQPGNRPGIKPATTTTEPQTLAGIGFDADGDGAAHGSLARSVAPNIGDGAGNDQQAGASEIAG